MAVIPRTTSTFTLSTAPHKKRGIDYELLGAIVALVTAISALLISLFTLYRSRLILRHSKLLDIVLSIYRDITGDVARYVAVAQAASESSTPALSHTNSPHSIDRSSFPEQSTSIPASKPIPIERILGAGKRSVSDHALHVEAARVLHTIGPKPEPPETNHTHGPSRPSPPQLSNSIAASKPISVERILGIDKRSFLSSLPYLEARSSHTTVGTVPEINFGVNPHDIEIEPNPVIFRHLRESLKGQSLKSAHPLPCEDSLNLSRRVAPVVFSSQSNSNTIFSQSTTSETQNNPDACVDDNMDLYEDPNPRTRRHPGWDRSGKDNPAIASAISLDERETSATDHSLPAPLELQKYPPSESASGAAATSLDPVHIHGSSDKIHSQHSAIAVPGLESTHPFPPIESMTAYAMGGSDQNLNSPQVAYYNGSDALLPQTSRPWSVTETDSRSGDSAETSTISSTRTSSTRSSYTTISSSSSMSPITTICAVEPNFTCNVCAISFLTNGELLTHYNREHDRRFACSDCARAFKLRADLHRHRRTVHREAANAKSDASQSLTCPNHGCSEAAKVWDRKDNLFRHIKRCRKRLQSQRELDMV